MVFEFVNTWILAVMLLATRLGMLFLFTPMDGFGRIPGRIRVLIVFSLSALLVSAKDLKLKQMPSNLIEFFSWQINELALGFIFVFGVYTAFASFQIAGKILDTQIGFGAAAVFDPASNTNKPLTGAILSLLALVLFFVTDAYQMYIRGLAFSLDTIPLGQSITQPLNLVIKQMSLMYSFGLILVAPVVMLLLLMDVGIAVSARVMPQMNVYFLFLPLKIFVGLMVTAISLKFLMPKIFEIFFSIFKYWNQSIS